MKSLTLYIDKWYIIGAICTNGVPQLIKMPNNREDRFWLYFYEDCANDNIDYGKDNQSHYRDKESHYFGDVFSRIIDPREFFTIYNRKREFKDIFEVSGIFAQIKKAFEQDKDIETYVSFSADITDSARKAFLDILVENGFIIKESVARIGHLALEYGCRKGNFKDEGYYLVLNACNENLHYSIFKHDGDYFNRIKEAVLNGMGTDLRLRALIEAVVDGLNARLRFLSPEEREEECLRMRQFVDDWAVKLANAKPNIPITIPNVYFSKQKANAYPVSVIRRKIDDRTSVIVNDIIRVISDFVNQSNIRVDEIKGILFLGNTFTNAQFEQSIREKFLVDSSNLIKYKETELPSIVGVYSVMDCTQFSEAKNIFAQNAEAEELRLKNAREDEERKKRAAQQQEEVAKAEKEAREAENKYKTYMEAAEECERNQDYIGMQDNCKDALAVRPDDHDAKLKLEEAIRLAAEEKAVAQQYNSIIQRAKKSFDDRQWSEAKAQAEQALNLKPQSKEAQRIYDESMGHINVESRIKEYMTRADLFLAQKSYDEAISELKKALGLDEDNREVLERLADIEERQAELQGKVDDLKKKLQELERNNKIQESIEVCEQLIEADPTNIRRWSEKIQHLKDGAKELEKAKQKLAHLKDEIDSALFDEKWDRIVSLCEQALQIEESSDIRAKLVRAQQKLQIELKAKEFLDKVSEIKTQIADRQFDGAKRALASLERTFSDKREDVKKLRAQIFKAEEDSVVKKVETKHRPIGFGATDDFFGTETKAKKSPSPTRPIPSQNKPSTTGDDFFDIDSSKHVKKTSVTSKANDGFDF